MHDFTLSVNALQFKIVGEKIHYQYFTLDSYRQKLPVLL